MSWARQEEENLNKDEIGLGAPYYWETKYKEEMAEVIGKVETFDWYVTFDLAWTMVESFLDHSVNHRILVVGCGRSNTVEVLYQQGFRDIVAIDISPSIIHKMQLKYEHLTGVEFFCMDVREMMTFSDSSFTFVIDKACIDSLMCMTDFVDSSERAFKEIFRVMKPDAVFCSISHCLPLARVPYLRLVRWAIDTAKMTEGEKLHLFVLCKTDDEVLLNRKVKGAEANVRPQAAGIVDSEDQTMNKSSTTRKAGGGGQLTVTSSLDRMMEMVNEVSDD
jgi:EEF1A lysine methyltransferase 4